MLSALIRAELRYPAVPRARQLGHKRFVPPNPLVLKKNLLKFRTPTADRDRPVSRRSEPSSRTTFIGEQPNPWELLHPQDAMSRHRTVFPAFAGRRLYLHLVADRSHVSIASLCMTRVGVLHWRNVARAFPFGSVVTGSIHRPRPMNDFPRYCRVVY